jgi:acyl dehydratase
MSLRAEDLLTDELRSWIGSSVGPIALPEEISASDVRRYAEATGDRNPLWLDLDFARAHGHRARVVPPAFVVELGWRIREREVGAGGTWHADLPLPPSYSDARNAGVDIEWVGPAYVGDRVYIEHRIADIQVREGRAGLGVHVTRESEYTRGPGDVVARMRQTIVRLPRADRLGASEGPR